MPELHAKLSPSAADRWFACPGSAVLSADIPESSSSYADEGTKAHGLAELMLTGKPCAVGYTAEMRDNVRVYVDHVKALADGPDIILQVEQQVKVSDDCWGTADALIWNPKLKTLYVRDLKYGAGVAVGVTNNLQLKIYALAALLTAGYPAEVIDVGVVQPRIPHADGTARSKEYLAVDLIDFHADLLDAIQRVKAAETNGDLYLKHRSNNPKAAAEWEDKYLHPTVKGCQWCPASATCPKVKQLAQETAKQAFTLATVDNGGVRSYDPAELADTLDKLPILEAWIKNVREFAYAEAEKGHAIPNYKLVEKQAQRKWMPDIADFLADMLGVEVSALQKEPEMKGVTEIEKMAPGKNEKERAAFLAPFVTKESSGHTLVHDSDKRPAVSLDPKSAFGEIPETAGETDSH